MHQTVVLRGGGLFEEAQEATERAKGGSSWQESRSLTLPNRRQLHPYLISCIELLSVLWKDSPVEREFENHLLIPILSYHRRENWGPRKRRWLAKTTQNTHKRARRIQAKNRLKLSPKASLPWLCFTRSLYPPTPETVTPESGLWPHP